MILNLLFPTLFLISSIFLSLSHGVSHFHYLPDKELLGMSNKYHVMPESKMLFLEGKNDEPAKNSTLILAARKTHRRDPLNNFNYYTGGWDFKNKHYWASVSFSAAPLFISAAVWFLLLGLCLFLACICCCCCRRKSYDSYSRVSYALSLILLILFTFGAIIGCAVLYMNQQKFNSSVIQTLQHIVKKGISILENLKSIWNTLVSAENVAVNQISLPPKIKKYIDTVNQMINATANIPQIQSLENTKNIRRVFDPVRLALNIFVAVTLILAFLGFLFSYLGKQFFVYILVSIGWILVTLIFILCGIFLSFHNVVADTCVAMDDWLQNPAANSALNLQLLPCMDNKTAQATLKTSKLATSHLIDIVNQYILDVANKDLPPSSGILYHNQSGPLVPILCNPFSSDMKDRKCASTETDFSNVAREWRKYVCQVSAAGICTTVGRLTPNTYDSMTASVNISYSLYHFGPFLVELGDCTSVMQTFSEISRIYCPSLRQYSFRTYVGLLMVSTSVMCSVIFWIFYARERRHRKYTKRHESASEENPIIGRRT